MRLILVDALHLFHFAFLWYESFSLVKLVAAEKAGVFYAALQHPLQGTLRESGLQAAIGQECRAAEAFAIRVRLATWICPGSCNAP